MERETPGVPVRSAFCPVCGREADVQFRRLGEAFCSEAHAAEFAEEVRAVAAARGDGETSKGRN